MKLLFSNSYAQVAIISSMLYSPRMEKNFTVRELKEYLTEYNINVRPIRLKAGRAGKPPALLGLAVASGNCSTMQPTYASKEAAT